MPESERTLDRRRDRSRAVLRAIVIRLAFCCLLITAAVLLLPDLRWWLLRNTAAENTAPSQAAPTGPGWPHLRGPHHNATSDETGLADSWPETGPPLIWLRPIGRGYSGVAVAGGRAYTQAQSLYAQYVLCLDARTGTTLWQHRYEWPYDAAGMYPGPRSTPTWHDGRVYFTGPRGTAGCLDGASGRSIWTRNVVDEFKGRGHDFGYGCSPLVVDGKVILPVGGKGASMVALDVRDGSTVWASGDEPASYCSAKAIRLGSRRLVVGVLQNSLTLTDLVSGRLWAEQTLSSGYDEHAAMPLYREPHLLLSFPFRAGADLYELSERTADAAGGAEISVKLIRHSSELSNDVASSVLVDDYVYGFDLTDIQAKAHRPSQGLLKCIDFQTGEVRWSTAKPGHVSLIAADGKLLLFSDRGEVLLARANPQQYEELGRLPLFGDEICWTSPALDSRRLYLRSPTQAACLEVGDPGDVVAQPVSPLQLDSLRPRERLDWTRLIAGEREYAADPPDSAELMRWYLLCLIAVLAPAAILGGAVAAVARRWRPENGRRFGQAAFWIAAFALGIAATPIGNRWSEPFVFTWPAALFVVHQLVLSATMWSGRPEAGRKGAWMAAVAFSMFLTTCGLYFHVCRQAGMAVQWVFLIGFVPSWLVAVPAAYAMLRRREMALDLAWVLASFTAYFWACGAFSLWKAA